MFANPFSLPLAILAYEQRALRPLVDELNVTERQYLRAMSNSLNEQRLASSAAVSQLMGKPQSSLSRTRAKLIGSGIIAAPEHGSLMFCIPYLADFVLKDAASSSAADAARRRMV